MPEIERPVMRFFMFPRGLVVFGFLRRRHIDRNQAAEARKQSHGCLAELRTFPPDLSAASSFRDARPRRGTLSAAPTARPCKPIPAIPRSRCGRAAVVLCAPRTGRAGY